MWLVSYQEKWAISSSQNFLLCIALTGAPRIIVSVENAADNGSRQLTFRNPTVTLVATSVRVQSAVG
jgi:hypothetical protein